MCRRISNLRIVQYEAKYAELAQSFQINPERCENPEHFESYLRQTALSDYLTGMATTHVAIDFDEEGNPIAICGFVALKTATIITDTAPLVGYPALEVSELAIDMRYESQGVGRAILEYVPFVCNDLRKIVGFRYLLVCALRSAVGYYEHVLGFQLAEGVYDIPREIWNESCIPMYLKLPEIVTERMLDDDDEDEWGY